MPELLVLRHSLALANEQRILMGAKLDSPLSVKGKGLARKKGRALRAAGFQPDMVYTSELSRAKETAALILNELDSAVPVTTLTDLNERDFGIYDSQPYEAVLAAFKHYKGGDPPTVEPVDSFVSRVMVALEQIKHETQGTTLVITHTNPLMVMQAALLQPERLQNFWELGDPPYCEGFSYTF